MISVLDYGIGNPGSLLAMFARLNIPAARVSTAEAITEAEYLVLPGVGHFDAGMKALNSTGLSDAVRQAALERRVPVLGICLGMQTVLGTTNGKPTSQV